MENTYQPPPEIVAALNEIGLHHGAAELPANASLHDLERAEYDPWDNDLLSAFGGLYVTPQLFLADTYALQASHAIAGALGLRSVPHGTHRILLLPGVELALDEDLVGWGDAAISFNQNPDGEWWRHFDVNTILSFLQAAGSGVTERARQQVQTLKDELHQEHLAGDEFLEPLNPADYEDTVLQWTHDFVGPVMEGWYKRHINNPDAYQPPRLRILNEQYVAEPPLPRTTYSASATVSGLIVLKPPHQ